MVLQPTASDGAVRHSHARVIPATSTYLTLPSGGQQGEASAVVQKPKLLDQVRAALRTRHYSWQTEKASVQWIKRFIFFHNKRHPREMGEEEVGQFLSSSPPRLK